MRGYLSKNWIFVLGISIILFFPGEISQAENQSIESPVQFQLPGQFSIIENQGQLDPEIFYHILRPQGNVFFAADHILYQFLNPHQGAEKDTVAIENLRVRFNGSSPKVKLQAHKKNEILYNFYQGKNPDSWVESAPAFAELRYSNLYPGIDLRVIQDQGVLKQEFLVRPEGDVKDISLLYEGAESISIDDQGRLEIRTASRVLYEAAPVSYQVIDGQYVPIASKYIINSDGMVCYSLGPYRKDKDLIIDPSLLYSTYLGGSQLDSGKDIVVDLGLNAYVVGTTQSGNFPKTPGAYDDVLNNQEVFVVKLDPTGSTILFATYFGGTAADSGSGISFSWGDESAVIIGRTTSDDMPTTAGAYDRTLHGDTDIFIAKLNSQGKLKFATYFGGSDAEWGGSVAVDGTDNIYFTGNTRSSDLPITPGAVDSTFDAYTTDYYSINDNIFVAKFNSKGSVLKYSTFYGEFDVSSNGIAVDFDGYAFVVGTAWWSRFPTTPGAYAEEAIGVEDGFILKLNLDGTGVEYATYIGMGSDDYYYHVHTYDVDVDVNGNAFVTGNFHPDDPPFFEKILTDRCFIAKFNPTGSQRLFEKMIHGDYWDIGRGVAVDGRGSVYLLAFTESSGLETTADAFQTDLAGDGDLYVAKFKASNGNLIYATYLGGSGRDGGSGIAADSYGSIYITGYTESFDFPATPGAFDMVYGGATDAFVARLKDSEAAGELQINKKKLKFKFSSNATGTKNKNFKISNTGSGKVSYSVYTSQDWMTVTPSQGDIKTEKDSIKFTADPNGLMAGTHTGVVTVASVDAFNSPQTLRVLLKIKGPKIKLSKKKYSVTATTGSENPQPLACQIRNSGSGRLRYRIIPQEAWLSVTRKKGKSTGEWDPFFINIDTTGLSSGIYQGRINITSRDTVDTAEILVILNLKPPE